MRGRGCGMMLAVGLGVEAGEQGVEGHGGVPFCRVAAPFAAFTGDPWPEAKTAGTRRRPAARGGQGRSAAEDGSRAAILLRAAKPPDRAAVENSRPAPLRAAQG